MDWVAEYRNGNKHKYYSLIERGNSNIINSKSYKRNKKINEILNIDDEYKFDELEYFNDFINLFDKHIVKIIDATVSNIYYIDNNTTGVNIQLHTKTITTGTQNSDSLGKLYSNINNKIQKNGCNLIIYKYDFESFKYNNNEIHTIRYALIDKTYSVQ